MPNSSVFYSFPYIFVFLITFFLTIPIVRYDKVELNMKLLFLFFIYFVFIGLRGYIFTDWKAYTILFDQTPRLFFDNFADIQDFLNSNFEKGFGLYNVLLKTIAPNWFIYQAISFSVDFVLLYKFFERYIPKYILLGFLFFYIFDGLIIEINLLRNSKAIIIFLLSLKFIDNKNIFKYFLMILLATMFHVTSVIFFPLYFLLNKKINKKIILFLFFIGNFIFLFKIRWVTNILVGMLGLIDGRLASLIDGYTKSEMWSSSYGITIGYIERTFSFILIYIFKDKLLNLNKRNNIFINIAYLYFFSFLFFSEMSILTDRIPILFSSSYWILYPQIYSLITKKNKYLFIFCLLFYGVLKLFVGTKTILCVYDNVINLTYDKMERIKMNKKYLDYIGVKL